jgi:hypothetical protein
MVQDVKLAIKVKAFRFRRWFLNRLPFWKKEQDYSAFEDNGTFIDFLTREAEHTIVYAPADELAAWAFGGMDEAVEAFKEFEAQRKEGEALELRTKADTAYTEMLRANEAIQELRDNIQSSRIQGKERKTKSKPLKRRRSPKALAKSKKTR